MTRVLLTGSSGRLGSAFLSLWGTHPQLSVTPLTRADADLSDPGQLADALRAHDYDVLVNPAAMSGLEQCLDHPAEAEAVNVRAPEVMAQACREKGARFVHFSTDYVFGGQTPGKKSEDDTPAPVNAYGRSKLAGERAAMRAFPDTVVARVSWLFGPTPPGHPCHFDHVLENAAAGTPQEFIHDKFSMPTFTHDVVGWTHALLENNSARGIYHLCNTGDPESWHSSATKLCQVAAGLGMMAAPPAFGALPISDAHFFREPRPQHTAMQPSRLHCEGIASPRHWLEAAADYLKIR